MSAAPADLERLRLRLAAGVPTPPGVDVSPRAGRALALAERVGAPALPALDAAAAAEADARRGERAVGVACAQARMVATGLLAAPVLLVPGLGAILGADLLAFYRTPAGLAVAAVVLALVAAGGGVVALLLRRARRAHLASPDPRARLAAVVAAVLAGLVVSWLLAPLAAAAAARLGRRSSAPTRDLDEVADLVATALAGGLAPPQALREVAEVRDDLAPDLRRLAIALDLGEPQTLDRAEGPLGPLATVLATADEVGAPVADALRRIGREQRDEDLARALAAAERLPAQLTFPTALCLLPAILLAIGAPLATAGLATAGA